MTANTPQSRKAKGRRFQQEVVRALLEQFPELTENDLKSTSMGKPGADIEMSQKALDILGIEPECKFVEKLNVHEAFKQTEVRAEKKGLIPVLFFKRSRSKPLACIELNVLLQLLRSQKCTSI